MPILYWQRRGRLTATLGVSVGQCSPSRPYLSNPADIAPNPPPGARRLAHSHTAVARMMVPADRRSVRNTA